MKKTRMILFGALLASTTNFFYSCREIGPLGPAGAAGSKGANGPSFKGAVAGFITLFDQYGKPIDVGLSGITISIDSLEKPKTSVVTNNLGYYIFPNVYTGYYSMLVQNPSTTPVYGNSFGYFSFVADTLFRNMSMSMQANFSPSEIVAHTNIKLSVDSLYITLANADTQTRQVIVFVGNSSTVSNSSYLYAFNVSVPVNKTLVYAVIQASTLYNLGFTSGSTAYYAVYGEPESDKSVYTNVFTGQNVYTALSTTSLTASTLVP